MNRLFRLVRFIIAWLRIPKGMYCYSGGRGTGRCPYWRRIKGRPDQADGWCNYLNKGDVEIAAEKTFVVTYVRDGLVEGSTSRVGDKISGSDFPGGSLLWDQCKECGIKDEK